MIPFHMCTYVFIHIPQFFYILREEYICVKREKKISEPKDGGPVIFLPPIPTHLSPTTGPPSNAFFSITYQDLDLTHSAQ